MAGLAKDISSLLEEHGRRAVGSVVVSQLAQVHSKASNHAF
jgi:hypothetical protein